LRPDLPEEVAVMLGLGERCPCGSTIRRLVQRLDGDRFDAVTGARIQQQLRSSPTLQPSGRHRAVAVDGRFCTERFCTAPARTRGSRGICSRRSIMTAGS
jgi:hypothetical protein